MDLCIAQRWLRRCGHISFGVNIVCFEVRITMPEADGRLPCPEESMPALDASAHSSLLSLGNSRDICHIENAEDLLVVNREQDQGVQRNRRLHAALLDNHVHAVPHRLGMPSSCFWSFTVEVGRFSWLHGRRPRMKHV